MRVHKCRPSMSYIQDPDMQEETTIKTGALHMKKSEVSVV